MSIASLTSNTSPIKRKIKPDYAGKSSKKKPKTRFEPKIYSRLKACRDGETKSFGTLQRKRLNNLSDGEMELVLGNVKNNSTTEELNYDEDETN